MKSYKTIIVDDEQISIKSISKIIQYNAMPLDIVGTFLSSNEALHYLQSHDIDLMITDINMPEYSGLDLLKKIYEIDPSVSVIIITGFGSLEYAREAMEYGVKHFLQKPFSPSELVESIEKSMLRVEEKRDAAVLRKKELIKAQIIGEEVRETFEESFSMLTYPERLFSEFHSSFDDWFRQQDYEYAYGILQGTVLYFIFKEGSKKVLIPPELREKRGVVVLQQELTLDQAKTAFYKAIPFYEKTFYFDQLKCFDRYDLDRTTCNLPIGTICSQVGHYLLDNNYLGLERSLLELYEKAAIDLVSVQQLKKCSKEIAKAMIEDSQLGLTQEDVIQLFDDVDHYRQLEERMMRLVLHAKVEKETDLTGRSISESINLIIENHFDVSDLSLKWIAKNKLFLNPEYMGKVYLKETGEKFTNHLLTTRMEKAADLLKQGLRVYEVAKLVGYENNPDYFGQQFKRYHGMTPRKYLQK